MYTVLIEGVPVQCETAAEAIAIVREAGDRAGGTSRPQEGPVPLSRWTEQRVSDFFRLIKPQQRKLVEALLETTDARTDEQLCQVLGLADGRSLAGVFTGLFKNAKKVGADPRDLYMKHAVTINDRRQFEYTLTETFRAAAKRWRN